MLFCLFFFPRDERFPWTFWRTSRGSHQEHWCCGSDKAVQVAFGVPVIRGTFPQALKGMSLPLWVSEKSGRHMLGLFCHWAGLGTSSALVLHVPSPLPAWSQVPCKYWLRKDLGLERLRRLKDGLWIQALVRERTSVLSRLMWVRSFFSFFLSLAILFLLWDARTLWEASQGLRHYNFNLLSLQNSGHLIYHDS